MITEKAFASRGRQVGELSPSRLAHVTRAGRPCRLSPLAATLAVLFLPVAAPGQVPGLPPSERTAAPLAAAAASDKEKLRLLEERYAALKNDYAQRTAELVESLGRLAESMARLGAVQDGKEEKKKLLGVNKTLRDLADAREQQRRSAEEARRQIESDTLALRVEFEELGALLAVAARNLAACDEERAAMLQAEDRRTAAARAPATTAPGLEIKSADLESVPTPPPPDNSVEIARLKEELGRARQQVGAQQRAVEVLRDEKDQQAEMALDLARTVEESTARIKLLQRQVILVEDELNTMRGQSWQ